MFTVELRQQFGSYENLVSLCFSRTLVYQSMGSTKFLCKDVIKKCVFYIYEPRQSYSCLFRHEGQGRRETGKTLLNLPSDERDQG